MTNNVFISSQDMPKFDSDKSGWPWTETSSLFEKTRPNGSPWPRISIVTPSYNQGQFIEETIRSVLLQGYPNLEYIIIDGGSSDGSLDIIKKYDSWITFWISNKDEGQADAINKGWEKSSGEILCWVNADDLILPGTLFTIAKKALANPNFHLIYGQSEWFDESGNKGIMGHDYSFEDVFQKMKNWDIPQPSTFISRVGLNKVGMLDIRLHQSLDKDLWYRLAATGEVIFLPILLSKFRIHKNQLTQIHNRSSEFYYSIERVIRFQNLFALGDLPEQYMEIKQEVLACVNLRASAEGRIKRNYRMMFKYLLETVRYPRGIFKIRNIAEISIIILGEEYTAYIARIRRKYLFHEST